MANPLQIGWAWKIEDKCAGAHWRQSSRIISVSCWHSLTLLTTVGYASCNQNKHIWPSLLAPANLTDFLTQQHTLSSFLPLPTLPFLQPPWTPPNKSYDSFKCAPRTNFAPTAVPKTLNGPPFRLALLSVSTAPANIAVLAFISPLSVP